MLERSASMWITGEAWNEPRYHDFMSEQGASGGEQPRTDANTDEHSYLLSVEEAADRYAAAGHPRTIRAIQKYCGRGDLESQKVETTYGERYLITPASVDRHIAMIIERSQANVRERSRTDAAGREQPRTDAAIRPQEAELPKAAPTPEQPRTDANGDERYVKALERENEFLRGQVTTKDAQIKELTERSRETNILIGGLQKMLTPLLGRNDQNRQSDTLHDLSENSGAPN